VLLAEGFSVGQLAAQVIDGLRRCDKARRRRSGADGGLVEDHRGGAEGDRQFPRLGASRGREQGGGVLGAGITFAGDAGGDAQAGPVAAWGPVAA
jgi:hypothetical protein